MLVVDQQQLASPMRLLEVLCDRFGAFEAVAESTIKLARVASEDELAMEPVLAEALLQFADDLRAANAAAAGWARSRGLLGSVSPE